MITRLQEAGFRTDFTPIYWAYASGFPKAMNIGKAVDKRLGFEREKLLNPLAKRQTGQDAGKGLAGAKSDNVFIEPNPVSAEAKLLEGSYGGFQPKPAVEVIIVAMKPLSEATFVDQALKNGKGVTWLDSCRIPINPNIDASQLRTLNRSQKTENDGWGMNNNTADTPQCIKPEGRFPANLLVSDDCLDNGEMHNTGAHLPTHNHGKDGFVFNTGIYGQRKALPDNYPSDEGEFSRFFSLDAWWQQQITKLPPNIQQTFPFIITPKADNTERNDGLENLPKMNDGHLASTGGGGWKNDAIKNPNLPRQNIHPTVKPLSLMCYLVTLGSRSNDLVVDPFVGSGTTAIACKVLQRNFIAFEKEKAYFDIAVERTHFSINTAIVNSMVTNSSENLTPENIEKAISHIAKPNQNFRRFFK